MSQPMQMHDLAGADDRRRFSPYCWRVRLALAHKLLEVETLPWQFTDKEAIAFSGQGRVPVLVDGERCVSDSWAIAEYLEQAYPERPSLFGGEPGHALTRFFNQWATDVLNPALARLLVPDIIGILHAKDRDYFRTTREKAFGVPIEALALDREANLVALRGVLKPLNGVLAQQPFLAGGTPNYADISVFGAFQWARVASPLVLIDADEPIAAWRERMLDAYGGVARAMPAAASKIERQED